MQDDWSSAHPAHLLVAGVAGLAVTVLEFAAVRFLAPFFGQSTYVWANVVGVILLALALGYWLGGRLADRSESGRPLYVAYLLGAAWTVGVAFLGGTVGQTLVPRGVDNDHILPLAFSGSLAASLLLFGPPTLILGMTSPFLVRLDDAPGRSGRTAGRIFAVGTIGSLLGCYVGPLWLFPTIGSRATILSAAAALAVLSVGGLLFGRGGRRARALETAGIGLLLLAPALAVLDHAPLRTDPGQLAEVESQYQVIRVVRAEATLGTPGAAPLEDGSEDLPTTFLRHDEDRDTYQSVWLGTAEAQRLLTGGRYYDHLALGAWLAGPSPRKRLRVLIVGYAGGTLHRVLALSRPPGLALDVLGVEIDPAVVAAARRWLGLDTKALDEGPGERLELLTGEDARTVVNSLPPDRLFDLVLVDAYTRTAYIPFQVASVEFFGLLSRHLAPGGWIGVNAHAGAGIDGDLLRSIATTMAAARGLGDAWIVPNPYFVGSYVIWAGHDGSGPPRLEGDVPVDPRLRTPAWALERLLVRHDPEHDGGHVLTDDRSDVDRLTDEDLGMP